MKSFKAPTLPVLLVLLCLAASRIHCDDSLSSSSLLEDSDSDSSPPPSDYLYLPDDDPEQAKRARWRANQLALIQYANLETSVAAYAAQDTGLSPINYPSDKIAKNVTLPVGLLGQPAGLGRTLNFVREAAAITVNNLQTAAIATATLPEPATLDDYANQYVPWGFVPTGLNGWRTDEHFGKARGTAWPLGLRRLTGSIPSFVLAPLNIVQRALLNNDLAHGRLFYENSTELLDGLSVRDGQTLNCSAWSLFRKQFPLLANSPLLPLGIHINGLWYTPNDAAHVWLYAKLNANCAIANWQPMQHFLWNHLLVSPLATAAMRQLGLNHPIASNGETQSQASGLLSAPLQYTHNLIALGFAGVFNPGSQWAIYSAIGGQAMHDLVNREWPKRAFTSYALEADLADRGISDLNTPWRNDMRAYWRIFEQRASSFINIYYESDADVVNDYELQAWAAEIASPTAGRVVGFPSSIPDRATLIQLCTHVMWNAVLHHSINHQSYKHMALTVPYAPWNLYCRPPTSKSDILSESWIVTKCMPKKAEVQQQIAHASNFNRDSPLYYRLLYSGHTDLTGTRDGTSRRQFSRRMQRLAERISSRDPNVVLPAIHLNPTDMQPSGYTRRRRLARML